MTDEQMGLIGREFRHFKGNRYRLEGFAKDSETLEEMVVYRALYGDGKAMLHSGSNRFIVFPSRSMVSKNIFAGRTQRPPSP